MWCSFRHDRYRGGRPRSASLRLARRVGGPAGGCARAVCDVERAGAQARSRARGRRLRCCRGEGPAGRGLAAAASPVARGCRLRAGAGGAEDELVQRLAAVQLRQAGADPSPEIYRPGVGHPGRGEPLARRRHPRLRRR